MKNVFFLFNEIITLFQYNEIVYTKKRSLCQMSSNDYLKHHKYEVFKLLV